MVGEPPQSASLLVYLQSATYTGNRVGCNEADPLYRLVLNNTIFVAPAIPQSADPAQLHVSGPGACGAVVSSGAETFVALSAIDVDSNPILSSIGPWSLFGVQIGPGNGASPPTDYSLRLLGVRGVDFLNGTYAVWYTPWVVAAGGARVELYVFLMGQLVSLCLITVVPQAINTSTSVVAGVFYAEAPLSQTVFYDAIRNEDSSFTVTANSSYQLQVLYRDAANNAIAQGGVQVFVSFAGPTQLLVNDTMPWTIGAPGDGGGCAYSQADDAATGGRLITYSCRRAGWYTVSVRFAVAGPLVGDTLISLQVLPGSPAARSATVIGPAAMVLGTCSDFLVRLRDAAGNGLVDNVTAAYQQRVLPFINARWYSLFSASNVSRALAVNLDSAAAVSKLSVPALRVDASVQGVGAYAGGGHYRVRACALSSSFFTAGLTYWLRITLAPTLGSPLASVDLVGESGSVALLNVTLLGGPPSGSRSALNLVDLADAHVGGTGPKLVRLALADKLGFACGNGSGALALRADPRDPDLVRGFIRHLQSSFTASVIVSVEGRTPTELAQCVVTVSLPDGPAGSYAVHLAVQSAAVLGGAGPGGLPVFLRSPSSPNATKSYCAGLALRLGTATPGANSFSLVVRDFWGSNASLASLSDVAIVLAPTAALQRYSVANTSALGCYVISYDVTVAGLYALSVLLHGVPIALDASGVTNVTLAVAPGPSNASMLCVVAVLGSAAANNSLFAGSPSQECPTIVLPESLLVGSSLGFVIRPRDSAGNWVREGLSAGQTIYVLNAVGSATGVALDCISGVTDGTVACALPRYALTTPGLALLSLFVSSSAGSVNTTFFWAASPISVLPFDALVTSGLPNVGPRVGLVLLAVGDIPPPFGGGVLSAALNIMAAGDSVPVAAGVPLYFGILASDIAGRPLLGDELNGSWCAAAAARNLEASYAAPRLVVSGRWPDGNYIPVSVFSQSAHCAAQPGPLSPTFRALRAAYPGFMLARTVLDHADAPAWFLVETRGDETAWTSTRRFITAGPATCDPARSYAVGIGLIQARAGTPSSFDVQLVDAWGSAATGTEPCVVYMDELGASVVREVGPVAGGAVQPLVGSVPNSRSLCVAARGFIPSEGCGAGAAAAAIAALVDPSAAPRIVVSSLSDSPGRFRVSYAIGIISRAEMHAPLSSEGGSGVEVVATFNVSLRTASGLDVGAIATTEVVLVEGAAVAGTLQASVVDAYGTTALASMSLVDEWHGTGALFTIARVQMVGQPFAVRILLSDAFGNPLRVRENGSAMTVAAVTCAGVIDSAVASTPVYAGGGGWRVHVAPTTAGACNAAFVYHAANPLVNFTLGLRFNVSAAAVALVDSWLLRCFDPPEDTISCIAGASCDVRLRLSGPIPNPCETGGVPYTAVVLDAVRTTVQNASIDVSPPALTVHFVGRVAGMYAVRVFCGGILALAPLNVSVGASFPDLTISVLFGQGIRRAIAGTTATPLVALFDAFGNPANVSGVDGDGDGLRVAIVLQAVGTEEAFSVPATLLSSASVAFASINISASGQYAITAQLFAQPGGTLIGSVGRRVGDTVIVGQRQSANLTVLPGAAVSFSAQMTPATFNTSLGGWSATPAMLTVDDTVIVIVTTSDAFGNAWNALPFFASTPELSAPAGASPMSPSLAGTWVSSARLQNVNASAEVLFSIDGRVMEPLDIASGAPSLLTSVYSGSALTEIFAPLDDGAIGVRSLRDTAGNSVSASSASSVVLHAMQLLPRPFGSLNTRINTNISCLDDGTVSMSATAAGYFILDATLGSVAWSAATGLVRVYAQSHPLPGAVAPIREYLATVNETLELLLIPMTTSGAPVDTESTVSSRLDFFAVARHESCLACASSDALCSTSEALPSVDLQGRTRDCNGVGDGGQLSARVSPTPTEVKVCFASTLAGRYLFSLATANHSWIELWVVIVPEPYATGVVRDGSGVISSSACSDADGATVNGSSTLCSELVSPTDAYGNSLVVPLPLPNATSGLVIFCSASAWQVTLWLVRGVVAATLTSSWGKIRVGLSCTGKGATGARIDNVNALADGVDEMSVFDAGGVFNVTAGLRVLCTATLRRYDGDVALYGSAADASAALADVSSTASIDLTAWSDAAAAGTSFSTAVGATYAIVRSADNLTWRAVLGVIVDVPFAGLVCLGVASAALDVRLPITCLGVVQVPIPQQSCLPRFVADPSSYAFVPALALQVPCGSVGGVCAPSQFDCDEIMSTENRAWLSSADVVSVCPALLPVSCWDGQCANDTRGCRAQWQAQLDSRAPLDTSSADEAARTAIEQLWTSGATSSATLLCPPDVPVRCPDGGCAVDAGSCPRAAQCPSGMPVRCAAPSTAVLALATRSPPLSLHSGDCVASVLECDGDVAFPALVAYLSSRGDPPTVSALAPDGPLLPLGAAEIRPLCSLGDVHCGGGAGVRCVPSWAWPQACRTATVSCGSTRSWCADGACYAESAAKVVLEYALEGGAPAASFRGSWLANATLAGASPCPAEGPTASPLLALQQQLPTCPPASPFLCEDLLCASTVETCLAGLVGRFNDMVARLLVTAASDLSVALQAGAGAGGDPEAVVLAAVAILANIQDQLQNMTGCILGDEVMPFGACGPAGSGLASALGHPFYVVGELFCPASAPVLCSGAQQCVSDIAHCRAISPCTLDAPVYCALSGACVDARSNCTAAVSPSSAFPLSLPSVARIPVGVPLCGLHETPCAMTGACMSDALLLEGGHCIPINASALLEASRVSACLPGAPFLCATGQCVRAAISSWALPNTSLGSWPFACPLTPSCGDATPVRCVGGPCVASAAECGSDGSLPLALLRDGSSHVTGRASTQPCPTSRPISCTMSGITFCVGASADGWSGSVRACTFGGTFGGGRTLEVVAAAAVTPPCPSVDDFRCPDGNCVAVDVAASEGLDVVAIRALYCRGACAPGFVDCGAVQSNTATILSAGNSASCVIAAEVFRCRLPVWLDADRQIEGVISVPVEVVGDTLSPVAVVPIAIGHPKVGPALTSGTWLLPSRRARSSSASLAFGWFDVSAVNAGNKLQTGIPRNASLASLAITVPLSISALTTNDGPCVVSTPSQLLLPAPVTLVLFAPAPFQSSLTAAPILSDESSLEFCVAVGDLGEPFACLDVSTLGQATPRGLVVSRFTGFVTPADIPHRAGVFFTGPLSTLLQWTAVLDSSGVQAGNSLVALVEIAGVPACGETAGLVVLRGITALSSRVSSSQTLSLSSSQSTTSSSSSTSSSSATSSESGSPSPTSTPSVTQSATASSSGTPSPTASPSPAQSPSSRNSSDSRDVFLLPAGELSTFWQSSAGIGIIVGPICGLLICAIGYFFVRSSRLRPTSKPSASNVVVVDASYRDHALNPLVYIRSSLPTISPESESEIRRIVIPTVATDGQGSPGTAIAHGLGFSILDTKQSSQGDRCVRMLVRTPQSPVARSRRTSASGRIEFSQHLPSGYVSDPPNRAKMTYSASRSGRGLYSRATLTAAARPIALPRRLAASLPNSIPIPHKPDPAASSRPPVDATSAASASADTTARASDASLGPLRHAGCIARAVTDSEACSDLSAFRPHAFVLPLQVRVVCDDQPAFLGVVGVRIGEGSAGTRG